MLTCVLPQRPWTRWRGPFWTQRPTPCCGRGLRTIGQNCQRRCCEAPLHRPMLRNPPLWKGTAQGPTLCCAKAVGTTGHSCLRRSCEAPQHRPPLWKGTAQGPTLCCAKTVGATGHSC
eukprot:417173-Pelagomonas_calceolata.AAC.3